MCYCHYIGNQAANLGDNIMSLTSIAYGFFFAANIALCGVLIGFSSFVFFFG